MRNLTFLLLELVCRFVSASIKFCTSHPCRNFTCFCVCVCVFVWVFLCVLSSFTPAASSWTGRFFTRRFPCFEFGLIVIKSNNLCNFVCLFICLSLKAGDLTWLYPGGRREKPLSPLSLPPCSLLTAAAVGNTSADLTRRPLRAHTPFQKYNPILTLLPARSHVTVLPHRD